MRAARAMEHVFAGFPESSVSQGAVILIKSELRLRHGGKTHAHKKDQPFHVVCSFIVFGQFSTWRCLVRNRGDWMAPHPGPLLVWRGEGDRQAPSKLPLLRLQQPRSVIRGSWVQRAKAWGNRSQLMRICGGSFCQPVKRGHEGHGIGDGVRTVDRDWRRA